MKVTSYPIMIIRYIQLPCQQATIY